jgi:hypothetical protein
MYTLQAQLEAAAAQQFQPRRAAAQWEATREAKAARQRAAAALNAPAHTATYSNLAPVSLAEAPLQPQLVRRAAARRAAAAAAAAAVAGAATPQHTAREEGRQQMAYPGMQPVHSSAAADVLQWQGLLVGSDVERGEWASELSDVHSVFGPVRRLWAARLPV